MEKQPSEDAAAYQVQREQPVPCEPSSASADASTASFVSQSWPGLPLFIRLGIEDALEAIGGSSDDPTPS
jgi:hypothetical protein